ncbi:MAG: protein jag [Terriglobia bacterium]
MDESRWVCEDGLDREAVLPALREFVEQVVRGARLDLRVEVEPATTDDPEAVEVVVDLDGRDAELLLERQGELLRALEHIAVRRLRLPPRYHDHIRFDCEGYRTARAAELKLAAETAAGRVRQSRAPFRFQPMEARERRILHLALKDKPGIRTASEGERDARAVVIYPAPEAARSR